jgi:uncharacterized protein
MSDPIFYEHVPASVEVRETHVSYVFLAGDLVFKLKKAVILPFADLGTAERRRLMCEEEVRLNRRLAGDVYRGVRAIVEDGDQLRLGGRDESGAIDHVVEMRRLDEASSLAARLGRGATGVDDIRAVADRIAGFHASAPAVVEGEALAMLDFSTQETFETLGSLAPVTIRAEVAAAGRFTHAFLASCWDEISARARAGLFREGHGDLRAEHVFLDDEVRVIDCAELAPRLRQIDVGADLAFLVMDLERRGAPVLAEQLVAAYREAGGDPGPDSLVAFHAAQRAWIRAKVALLRADELDPQSREGRRQTAEAAELAALARRFAWRARGPLVLVVCGPAASGKTTLAAEIARRARIEPIGSDLIRKRLAGLAPSERGGADLYTPERSRQTYGAMGRLAREALALRGCALVDATFRRRRERDTFAAALGDAEVVFVECRAPARVVDHRARRREADPDRISDATAEIAIRQREEWEPLNEVPARQRLVALTDCSSAEAADSVEAGLDVLLHTARDGHDGRLSSA